MKKTLLLGIIFLCAFLNNSFSQSAGFNTTYIVLNNAGSQIFYDLNAATGNPDFEGNNLGTFVSNSGILEIKGAEHNVYKCGGCDLTSTRVYYRIYPTGSPTGSFIPLALNFSANTGDGNPCGGQSQRWSNTGYTVNVISGLNAGNYTLDVYSDATVTCSGGTIFASNGGNNYKATFTVHNNQNTADFRSKASGNFNATGTWEYNTISTTYANATQVPTSLNNVTIQNGHTVTQDINYTVGSNKTLLLNATSAYIIAAGNALSVDLTGTANFNGQSVTFQSNGTNSIVGRLGVVSGSLTGATNVTVERFIPAGKRAYRQLSSGLIPSTNIFDSWQNAGVYTAGIGLHVTGSTTGANGLDATQTGNPNLFTLTAGSPTFTPVLSTNQPADKLNALRGYRLFVYGDRAADLTASNNGGNPANNNIALNSSVTLKSTGTLITGSVAYTSAGASINGGATDATANLGANVNDYSFIANPFWSPVDFDALAKANVNPTYYIWDPTIGTRGAYTSWTTGTGSSAGAITKDIQPGQSIFVRTSAANPSITFAEANKTAVFTNTFRTSPESPSKMMVSLIGLSTGNNVLDGLSAAFRDDFSSAVGNEDALKFTNTDENIAITRNGSVLGVEGRPTVASNDTTSIQLWRLYSSSSYALRFEGMDFDAGIEAFVEDKYLGQVHPLNMSGTFQLAFSFSATDSASFYNRFRVIYRPVTVLPVAISSVRAFARNSGAVVEWTNATESNMDRYEVERSSDASNFTSVGSVAARLNNSSEVRYSFFDANIIAGDNYYRVKAIGLRGEVKYSTIVKVTVGKTGIMISAFPNPVKDGRFTVQLNDVEKGAYKLSLNNHLGQEVYVQQVQNSGGSYSQAIDLSAEKLSMGVYTLQLRSAEGKLLSSEQIVFNK